MEWRSGGATSSAGANLELSDSVAKVAFDLLNSLGRRYLTHLSWLGIEWLSAVLTPLLVGRVVAYQLLQEWIPIIIPLHLPI